MGEKTFKIKDAVLWVAAWFGVMLFYTFLHAAVWRNVFPDDADWLNSIVILLCAAGFLVLLKRRYEIPLFANVTLIGLLLAVCCSVLFFLLLDQCLDPLWESLFPQSEQAYQETVQSLMQSPVTSLLQIGMIAPVIEETLMRGFVLEGLRHTYGVVAAWFLSSFFFAVLHFNMVQTLSAFVCGMILGLLYLRTRSLLCCIIAHGGYNVLSYLALLASCQNRGS